MVTYPHISLTTNPWNLNILLQSITKLYFQWTTSRPSFGLQSIATLSNFDLVLVDLFYLFSMSLTSNLPGRTTSTFNMISIPSNLTLHGQTTSTFVLLLIPSILSVSRSTSTKISFQII
jgi:hypothetical protein